MLVSIFLSEDQPGENTRAALFGINLIPLVFNPPVTFILRRDCAQEFMKCWNYFKECLGSIKKSKKATGMFRQSKILVIVLIKSKNDSLYLIVFSIWSNDEKFINVRSSAEIQSKPLRCR